MNSHKKNILISGSVVYDRIMDFPGAFKDHIMADKIHILNVSFSLNGVKESFGGTAGNIAYNLTLLGERPTVLSNVGKDFSEYKNWFRKSGIALDGLKTIPDRHTASAYIITDRDDNQITAFNPGAMGLPRGRFNEKYLKNALAIISPGNPEDMLDYAKLYRRRKVSYIFDPGQQVTVLEPAALATAACGAGILIGNDYEIELIRRKLKWTIKRLFGKINTLIITKGGQGSEIYIKGKKSLIKAAKAEKIPDPTGAGDAYRAGLIKGLASGWPAARSARLASAVASFAVEQIGTQNHRFSLKQLSQRFEKTYGEKLNEV